MKVGAGCMGADGCDACLCEFVIVRGEGSRSGGVSTTAFEVEVEVAVVAGADWRVVAANVEWDRTGERGDCGGATGEEGSWTISASIAVTVLVVVVAALSAGKDVSGTAAV